MIRFLILLNLIYKCEATCTIPEIVVQYGIDADPTGWREKIF